MKVNQVQRGRLRASGGQPGEPRDQTEQNPQGQGTNVMATFIFID